MQALDSAEVRKRLAEDGEFTVNDILDAEDEWEALAEIMPANKGESEETSDTALSSEEDMGHVKAVIPQIINNTNSEEPERVAKDSDIINENIIPTGCGVIVVKDGKILVGTRKDTREVCGPGGHIEICETPEDAAIRETREEFGINIDKAQLIPIDIISGMPSNYCTSATYLCTEYFGEPFCFNTEMEDARWLSMEEIRKEKLYLPFELSLDSLYEALTNNQEVNNITIEVDGREYKRKQNGQFALVNSSGTKRKSTKSKGQYRNGYKLDIDEKPFEHKTLRLSFREYRHVMEELHFSDKVFGEFKGKTGKKEINKSRR